MRKDLDGTSRKGQMKAKAPRESGKKSKSKERAPKKIKYSLMEGDWGERRSEPDPLKDGDQDDRRGDEDSKEAVVVGGEQSSTTPDQETLQASQTPARIRLGGGWR